MSQVPKEGSENDLDRSAALKLLISIARAFKAIDDRVRSKLAAGGLSMTEFAVLEVLYHKGRLPLGELADRILVTGASTTYIVKKLEKRKLMARRVSSEDQRVVFGEITETGRKLVGKIFPLHAEDLRHAMAGLSRQEKKEAALLMRKLEAYAKGEAGRKQPGLDE